MKNFSEIACKNFRDGYGCAQSVLLAFAKELKLDPEMASKLSSSFGGGMGRMREVCGAVSAMFMIAGILNGYTNPNDDIGKTRHYQRIQTLAKEFIKNHNSIICRDILNLGEGWDSPIPSLRTEQFYDERPCEECIKTASTIIEKEFFS